MLSRNRSTLYIIGAVILIVLVGLLGRVPLQLRWLAMMVVFLGLLAAIGRDVTGMDKEVAVRSGRTEKRFAPGRIDGVLIDNRNKVSLSRLQLILWSVVVLSAWTTLAFHRVIPVLQGRTTSSSTAVVREIAGILGNDGAGTAAAAASASDEDMSRAGAVMEILTGEPAVEEDNTGERLLYHPLDIDIPQEVLVALGISVASLAAAGLIKTRQATTDNPEAQEVAGARLENALRRTNNLSSNLESMKREAQSLETLASGGLESLDAPTPEELAAANAQLAAVEAELRATRAAEERARKRAEELLAAQDQAVGNLHFNDSAADARWSDMLRGDTIANFRVTDLGKIQMLLITIVLVVSYAWLIWSIMSMPQASGVLQVVPSVSLPTFPDSLNVLLAVSHGGYLTTKTNI